uniref:Uncharacterized protein n=1 Tax=Propithecus coquereli TaxID=379532 RepID=A0A2K6F6I9_PROCO
RLTSCLYELEGKGAPHSIRPLGVQQPEARFLTAAALLPRTTASHKSCGHTPGRPRPATPTRPLPSPCPSGQWRNYEWHDLPELGSLQLHGAWKPGKTLLLGDGSCTPSNLPVSLESPNHSSANWLRDVAGCHFPMGLCGTPLTGD